MTVRLLDLATCTCAISAPDRVHDAMLPYVQPYLVAALKQPDFVLTIACDAAVVARIRRALAGRTPTAIRASHPQQRYHVWTVEDQETLLPEHRPQHVITTSCDHIFLTADQPKLAATIATRIIRQLIMRGGEAAGGHSVHAGAVDIEGDGMLIGGHPGAGKTGVLTHLIEHRGGRPVANDRTVAVPDGNRSWRAVGVPMAWRFTPEGVAGSPALTAALSDYEPSRGGDLVDGKVELTPAEISRVFGRPTVPTARITRIVVLLRTAAVPPNTPDASFVRRHLDFGATDFFGEDWLGIRSRLAGNHDQPSAGSDGWWDELVATVPIQVLSWTDPAELRIIAAAVASGVQA